MHTGILLDEMSQKEATLKTKMEMGRWLFGEQAVNSNEWDCVSLFIYLFNDFLTAKVECVALYFLSRVPSCGSHFGLAYHCVL
jgi:hypothetical protein